MADIKSYYLATNYKVAVFTLPIRIGQIHPELEALLLSYGHTQWCYLTSWNPRSQWQELETNQSRNKELLSMIEETPSYKVFPGVGESPDGDWSEESFLILGMDEKAGYRLAVKFEQNAFVCGEKGSVAKLVMTELS
ncbi:DUF3293 domain-containing protein [Leptospira ognonensis]|uniref:DUF3293 domain-containing protein n=2 Tax=Leptospira ognonensis TaxID=2484945 RepID=A0A4R9JZ93_9LEPT|nr:DUF3293 domain-containing protein [Leptospira ognonensis]